MPSIRPRPPLSPAAFRKVPDPLKLAAYLKGCAWRFADEKLERTLQTYQYSIAIKPMGEWGKPDLGRFQIIHPPRSQFWADPFLITHEGKTWVFFENFVYAEKKGLISFFEMGSGEYLLPEVALERPYHLSYHFLFRQGDDIFMMPETAENRTVELYRAVEFPHRWELHQVLMRDVDAHDPTLLEFNGKLWLFVNMVESGGSFNDELFLFYADSLAGPWIPHPKNPVVSSVFSARPAGQLFMAGGKLIRPSQDCSKRYGYGLNFNHVEVLNETDYRESLLHKVVPDGFRNFKGVHTYNAGGGYEVIDLGRYVVPRYGQSMLARLQENAQEPRRVSSLPPVSQAAMSQAR